MPVEGILLDQYSWCPYSKDLPFDMKTVQDKLDERDMRLYLAIQAALPTVGACWSTYRALEYDGCLLNKTAKDYLFDYATGISIDINANHSWPINFIPVAFIDVFKNLTSPKGGPGSH